MPFALSSAAAAKLDELASSAAAPEVLADLRRRLEGDEAFLCYKINPLTVAKQTGVTTAAAVRTYLFATRLGLTDLTWDIHCPSCLGVPVFYKHLMELEERAHCPFCDFRWALSLEDQVEVTFTVNADVRPLPDYSEKVWYDAVPRLARDERMPSIGLELEPGQVTPMRGDLIPGDFRYLTAGFLDKAGKLRVEGPRAEQEQLVRIVNGADGAPQPQTLTLRPGPACFEVESRFPMKRGFFFQPVGTEKNWLSAAYVSSLQDFRDLFSGEFLSADVSFGIRSATLMFTDVKGSTELYEQLGDARAFALVKEHFGLMSEVIARHEGGVVKTIGDAVMASFPVNQNAVRAALDIQEGFAKAKLPLGSIEVKIGLHRGPTIAVTSNRALDYFGRTVNIAARVQGASQAGEVLLTDAVLSDPAAAAALEERNLTPRPRQVELKGVGTMKLHGVQARPGRAG
ncbi:MAG: DUF5939 domain-containing protein [Myxococcaceae bacterium]